MPSADYTRLAQHLPAVYQDDAASFAQIDMFLGLVDELDHAYLERLEDLAMTLGPDAALRWPTDLPLDAGGDALIAAYLSVYDEVARWASFVFPASWGRDEDGVVRRRELLARMARIWRRRGTPRGFLDWFCLAFGVAARDRPYLLEHFKVPGAEIPDPDLTATLLVPTTEQFTDYQRRQEVLEFVDRYAPAHVLFRVCWVRNEDMPKPPPRPPRELAERPIDLPDLGLETARDETRDEARGDKTLADFYDEVDEYRAYLRALLCSTTSFIDHANGMRLWDATGDCRTIDQLDVGHLPSED